MDGMFSKTIVDHGLVWPNGLCLDYSESRIFWADAHTDRSVEFLFALCLLKSIKA